MTPELIARARKCRPDLSKLSDDQIIKIWEAQKKEGLDFSQVKDRRAKLRLVSK